MHTDSNIAEGGSEVSNKDDPDYKLSGVYTGRPHTAWANVNAYKCAKCGVNAYSLHSLSYHYKKVHNVVSSSLREMVDPKMDTARRYHECLICESSVLHTGMAIGTHVRTKHRVTLKYYYRHYIKPTLGKGKKRENATIEILAKEGRSHLAPHVAWADANTFKCAKCELNGLSSRSLFKHFKEKTRCNMQVTARHHRSHD